MRYRIIEPGFDLEYSKIINLYPKDNKSLPVQIGLITVGASHKDLMTIEHLAIERPLYPALTY